VQIVFDLGMLIGIKKKRVFMKQTKTLVLKLFLVSALFILAGCSSKYEFATSVETQGTAKAIVNAQVPKDSSYIYVYHENGLQGAAMAWFINYNGKKEFKIKNGSYFLIKTDPGKKVLTPVVTVMGATEKALTLDAKAGQAHFLKLDYSGFWVAEFTLFPQMDKLATRDLLSPYDLVDIYEDYDPSLKRAMLTTAQECSSQSQDPACFTTVEEILGKVTINRQNKGFRAKPGMRLLAGDNIITNETATLYFLQYGEPMMIKPNSTYKVPAR